VRAWSPTKAAKLSSTCARRWSAGSGPQGAYAEPPTKPKSTPTAPSGGELSKIERAGPTSATPWPLSPASRQKGRSKTAVALVRLPGTSAASSFALPLGSAGE
jgi:hypothetical protein